MKSPRMLFQAAAAALLRRLVGHNQPQPGKGRTPRKNGDKSSDEWVKSPSREQHERKVLARRGSSGAGTRTEADLLLEDSLFHGQRVLAVSEDLHLPHWFTDALCVATVQGRGGIGKQVNWPVFVHEYPMHIQHMAKRMNAPSAMFDELRAWAAAEELQPSFDADFYMERGGSIGGWSFTFWTNKEPSPAQIDEATTITARHNHEPSWIEPVMEETNNGEGGGKRARWTYYL